MHQNISDTVITEQGKEQRDLQECLKVLITRLDGVKINECIDKVAIISEEWNEIKVKFEENSNISYEEAKKKIAEYKIVSKTKTKLG